MVSSASELDKITDVTNNNTSRNLRSLKSSSVHFASFLGDNAFEFYRQIVGYLGDVTGITTELVSGIPATKQDQMVDTGEIQAVFTCGLPYVRKADSNPPLLSLMAAPVMLGARYCDKPVYYSDVIVRADSPYQTFEDLRDTTFAYNEVHSLSGYMLPCYHLLTLGETGRFFAKTVRSGSHALSMEWVEEGRVAAAAIDSVVLEMEIAQRSERAWSLRVIENMGPTTMPPVAASNGLPDNLSEPLRQALLNMHTTEQGWTILREGDVRRFAPVVDADYDPIRHILQALQEAGVTKLQ